MTVDAMLEEYRQMTDNALEGYFAELLVPETASSVTEAMKYSTLGAGKRIRPALLLEFCRVCGGEPELAVPFACAVEMIHTYSLIHDDLPCMDNDDLRRGKPSCHKAFGEDIALLAGDGLLTLAFQTALKTKEVPASSVLHALRILADAAGICGMIGGQVIDLACEEKAVTLETLTDMYERKTGAMIRASAQIGCILAGMDESLAESAGEYGKYIGLSFQIVDDILDTVGDEALLGKPVGSDAGNKKSTYVSLLGLESAHHRAEEYAEKAKQSLAPFGSGASTLIQLVDYLADRKY